MMTLNYDKFHQRLKNVSLSEPSICLDEIKKSYHKRMKTDRLTVRLVVTAVCLWILTGCVQWAVEKDLQQQYLQIAPKTMQVEIVNFNGLLAMRLELYRLLHNDDGIEKLPATTPPMQERPQSSPDASSQKQDNGRLSKGCEWYV